MTSSGPIDFRLFRLMLPNFLLYNIILFSQAISGMLICLNLTQKSASTPTKEGSSVRPKGTMLERAIRDLEKIVAECKFDDYLEVSWKFKIITLISNKFVLCSKTTNFGRSRS